MLENYVICFKKVSYEIDEESWMDGNIDTSVIGVLNLLACDTRWFALILILSFTNYRIGLIKRKKWVVIVKSEGFVGTWLQ